MLYWDADRRISVAMVSNNTLAPGRQQRLQRALVVFAEKRTTEGLDELRSELPDNPVQPGTYVLPTAETVVVSSEGNRVSVMRSGIPYPAYRIGAGISTSPVSTLIWPARPMAACTGSIFTRIC